MAPPNLVHHATRSATLLLHFQESSACSLPPPGLWMGALCPLPGVPSSPQRPLLRDIPIIPTSPNPPPTLFPALSVLFLPPTTPRLGKGGSMLIPTGVRDQSRRGCGAKTEVLDGVLATEQRGCLWVTGFERVSGRRQGDTRDSPRFGTSDQEPVSTWSSDKSPHPGFGWILSGSAGFGLARSRRAGFD